MRETVVFSVQNPMEHSPDKDEVNRWQMMAVVVRADNERMLAFREPLRQLVAEPVCFFRRNLTRRKGLAKMIGDHVVLAAYASGRSDVLLLGKVELGVSHAAVAFIAGNEPPSIRFGVVLHVVDDLTDRS